MITNAETPGRTKDGSICLVTNSSNVPDDMKLASVIGDEVVGSDVEVVDIISPDDTERDSNDVDRNIDVNTHYCAEAVPLVMPSTVDSF